MLKIVIADDDAIFLNGIRNHIPWQTLGIEVAGVAANGADALLLCRQHEPDIVLLDLRMPLMDGMSSAVRIHEAVPHCHILFMSAYAQTDDYRKAMHLRALDFLEKPLDVDELTTALTHAAAQIEKQDTPATLSQPSGVIKDVMRYIDCHYMESLTVEELARFAYFTPNYLSTLFHRETGNTISQYIAHVRVEAAAVMLADPNQTITQISQSVGYRDVKHFIKVFQKHMNKTPTEFKRGR